MILIFYKLIIDKTEKLYELKLDKNVHIYEKRKKHTCGIN